MLNPQGNRLNNKKFLVIVMCLFLFQNFSNVYGNDRAIDSLRLVLDAARNSTERMHTLIAIGDFQENQSFEYREAFMTYDEVRKLAKRNKDTLMLGKAIYRQALMLMAMGETKTAYDYFDSIIGVSKEGGLIQLVLLGNQGKGQIYFKNQEYNRALDSFDLASQAAKEIEDFASLSELYYLQSKVHNELENLDKASKFLEMAQTVWKKPSLPSKYVFLKGQIAFNNTQVSDAIFHYKEALELAENSEKFFVQSEILQLLIDFYRKQNQWEEVKQFEKKQNHILNTQPAKLNESHLGEIIYFHAYQEVSSVKEKNNRNQVIYTSLVALLLFAFGIYIIKKQRGYIKLIQSVKDAQFQFMQEKFERYTKN